MPSFGLYRTWYPHFLTTFTIKDITCTLLITSHTLYMTSHLLCMMSHSLCVSHHTMTLSLAPNTICLWYIHLIWQQAQCYDHTTIVCLPSHYAWHYTQCIFDLTDNIPILWKALNVCHHSLYMYGTVCTTYDITYTIFDIVSTLCLSPNPLCWWYHCKSIYEIASSIYVNIISIVYNKIFTIFVPSHPLYLFLTPTLSMISHPLYIWHCTHYMFNIRYTI